MSPSGSAMGVAKTNIRDFSTVNLVFTQSPDGPKMVTFNSEKTSPRKNLPSLYSEFPGTFNSEKTSAS